MPARCSNRSYLASGLVIPGLRDVPYRFNLKKKKKSKQVQTQCGQAPEQRADVTDTLALKPSTCKQGRGAGQHCNKSDSKKPDRLEKQSQMSVTRCPKLDHLTSPEFTSLVTRMAGTLAT